MCIALGKTKETARQSSKSYHWSDEFELALLFLLMKGEAEPPGIVTALDDSVVVVSEQDFLVCKRQINNPEKGWTARLQFTLVSRSRIKIPFQLMPKTMSMLANSPRPF